MKTHLNTILFTIILAVSAVMMVSCSDDDSLASRGLETVEMPVSISIPAEGFVNPVDAGIGNNGPSTLLAAYQHDEVDTRGAGDPGTAETFVLPRYLYIYLVSVSQSNVTRVYYKKVEMESSEWKLASSAGNVNDHFSDKDGLYVYQGHIAINLPIDRKEGRVYAVASNIDLDDSGADNKYKLVTEVSSWTSDNDVVEKVTFTNQSALRDSLQNIYSSPYNLQNAEGGYYGTVKDYNTNVPHIDMVLYHVATKVDLQWTIEEPYQGTKEWEQVVRDKNGSSNTMRSTSVSTDDAYNKVFFSFIEARKLPKENLPLFKPMAVTSASGSFDVPFLGEEISTGNKDSNGRNEYYQVLPDTEKAGMYYGRKVIYVMPKLVTASTGDYYDIPLRILVNNYTTSKKDGDTYTSLLTGEDHASTGYHIHMKILKSSVKATGSTDGNPVFATWLRARLHVKSETDVGNLVKFTDP